MFGFFKKEKPTIKETKIEKTQDYNDVEAISKYFQNETGVTFDNQTSILKNKVTAFCRLRKINSFSKLLDDIKYNSQLKQELIDHLTTNETFFYREFKQVEELVALVKKSSSSNVSILCAPSATGEEPYSIAIALLEAGVSPNSFHILGIDINSDAISKAQTARYKERNIRKMSSELVEKYFTKEDDIYILHQSVKSLVSFKIANLFDDSFKHIGKFDFIFSRNMLIYFDKETKIKAKAILEKMRKSEEHNIFFGHADLF